MSSDRWSGLAEGCFDWTYCPHRDGCDVYDANNPICYGLSAGVGCGLADAAHKRVSMARQSVEASGDGLGLPGICKSEVVVMTCQINTSGDYWNG
jgi:hypothetical protein